jgi:rfaE bifunctional protein kinase chain/domain
MSDPLFSICKLRYILKSVLGDNMLSASRFNEIISKFSQIDPILVVGDVGIDKYTYGDVNRISPEAPVPILEVQKEWTKLGLAANVLDNLQSLEVKASLCGIVGDDNNANLFERLLEDCNQSTWGVVRDSERMTTLKERVVTPSQQICRIDYESRELISDSVFEKFEKRINEFSGGHGAFILEDYGKGLFDQKTTQYLIDKANANKQMVVIDPSRTTNPLFYKGADLLKPNKLESTLMVKTLGYQETDASKCAQILMDKLKLKKVIITLGSQGMGMLDASDSGGFKTIPTVASEVFDVSGAGDTAISAIVSALVSGANLEEAAWLGNCASGVVVGKKGTALVTQEELAHFFRSFQ